MYISDQNYPFKDAQDKLSKAVITIDNAHHELHEGNHFLYTDSVSLNSGSSQDYMIFVPNFISPPHMFFMVDGSAITQIRIYESGDRAGTTGQTIINSNRNSLNVSQISIYKDTNGGTTDGTIIYQYKSGSASNQSKSPTSERNEDELILKKYTNYIFRITSSTDSNLTNIKLSWYEPN